MNLRWQPYFKIIIVIKHNRGIRINPCEPCFISTAWNSSGKGIRFCVLVEVTLVREAQGQSGTLLVSVNSLELDTKNGPSTKVQFIRTAETPYLSCSKVEWEPTVVFGRRRWKHNLACTANYWPLVFWAIPKSEQTANTAVAEILIIWIFFFRLRNEIEAEYRVV